MPSRWIEEKKQTNAPDCTVWRGVVGANVSDDISTRNSKKKFYSRRMHALTVKKKFEKCALTSTCHRTDGLSIFAIGLMGPTFLLELTCTR